MTGWLKKIFKRSGQAPAPASRPAGGGPGAENMLRFDWDQDGWVDMLIKTRFPELRTKADLLVKLVVEDIKRSRHDGQKNR